MHQVFPRIFRESCGVTPSVNISHPGTSYVCMTAGVQVDAMHRWSAFQHILSNNWNLEFMGICHLVHPNLHPPSSKSGQFCEIPPNVSEESAPQLPTQCKHTRPERTKYCGHRPEWWWWSHHRNLQQAPGKWPVWSNDPSLCIVEKPNDHTGRLQEWEGQRTKTKRTQMCSRWDV